MNEVEVVTEQECTAAIEEIYEEYPEFHNYPLEDWCECRGCQRSEILERHGPQGAARWFGLQNWKYLRGDQ